jgi:hypothetical protein
MKQIPDTTYNELLALTKTLQGRPQSGTVKYANACRKARLLYKKLLKLNQKSNEL